MHKNLVPVIKMCHMPFFVPNPIFSANNPQVPPEGVGSSQTNCQGSYPGGGDTLWQRPHYDAIQLWGAAYQ